ncbi:MAG: hypothetical protein HY097_03780 [Nitrospinae bacterium]|nr:hypothetical protein [Nitrospinota bacterium]MBI3814319.1 hypothetical protein [Nitrospinota bacterium]
MNGIKACGGKELKQHQEGKRLTYKQALHAKCYDCMGVYVDGRADCGVKR